MVSWPKRSSKKLSEQGRDRPQKAFLCPTKTHPTRGNELVEVLGVVLREEKDNLDPDARSERVAYFLCKYGDGTETELPLSDYLHTLPMWYFEHEITTQPRVKR